jgi:hypothetical protein
MILDAELRFSNAQAVTATAVGTDVIPLSVARAIGVGEPMAVVFTVGVAADFTTGDETYSFSVETDDNAAMSSATTIGTKAVLTPLLQVGDKVVIPIGFEVLEEFIGVRYTVAGTTPTITCDAYLQPMRMIDGYTNYADNVSIT